MKLAQIWRSVSWRCSSKYWIALLLHLIIVNPTSAQDSVHKFVDTPLSEALLSISKEYGIKVAFDHERLSSIIINKSVSGKNNDELISELLMGTGTSYEYKYGRFLIMEEQVVSGTSECQIIGSITDKSNGEQLPYANVVILNSDLHAITSSTGSFSMKDVRTNPLHILVSYIGYDQLDTTITWSNPALTINIGLNRNGILLDSVIVSGYSSSIVEIRNDINFATTINPIKLIDLPTVTETDVFKALQLLPGVSYNDNSAGLTIRGGSTDQNLVRFDGQTLYNLSHYYGVISALNPNIIKDVQIYKGGYDARFGERVSGIIDITGKTGNKSGPKIYGDINLLSTNITAELPIGEKLSLITAFRRSYSDIYSTNFAENLFENNGHTMPKDSNTVVNTTRPKYYFIDYNAKLTYNVDDFESFEFNIYGSKDYFYNSYSNTKDSLLIDVEDEETWSNFGLGASWLKQWNETLYTDVQLGVSGYIDNSSSITNIDKSGQPGANPGFLPFSVNNFNKQSENKLRDVHLSIDNSYKVSNKNQIDFGFTARSNIIEYKKMADRTYIYENSSMSGLTLSAYLQDRYNISKKLSMKGGLRTNYFTGDARIYLEPRVSVNYDYSDHISARLAAGRYHQFISQVISQQETNYNNAFWVLANDREHPVISSNHYVAGLTFEYGKFLVDMEGYYKTTEGIQEYIYVSEFRMNYDFDKYFDKRENNLSALLPSYYITGSGLYYGLDAMVKYESHKFTGWLSYSYGRSLLNFENINNNEKFPSDADLPHQLSFTSLFSPGKWNFGSTMVYSTGKPYIAGSELVTQSSFIRNYKRLPDFFRLDLSVNYNFTVMESKFKTGLTFMNLLNTVNYYDINTRKFDFNQSSFYETTLIQSQSFGVNFFIHYEF